MIDDHPGPVVVEDNPRVESRPVLRTRVAGDPQPCDPDVLYAARALHPARAQLVARTFSQSPSFGHCAVSSRPFASPRRSPRIVTPEGISRSAEQPQVYVSDDLDYGAEMRLR